MKFILNKGKGANENFKQFKVTAVVGVLMDAKSEACRLCVPPATPACLRNSKNCFFVLYQTKCTFLAYSPFYVTDRVFFYNANLLFF